MKIVASDETRACPHKVRLKEELAGILVHDLATRERSHRAACEAATHDEAKPENDKDTRALEQSYLARGEARRCEELRASLAEVQSMDSRDFSDESAVVLGALVTLTENGQPSLVWLAPQGGGSRLADATVQVITPRSPLGHALLGRRAGDVCEIVLAGKRRELTIVAVK